MQVHVDLVKPGDLIMGMAVVGVLLMLLICGDWGDDDDGPDGLA